MKGALLDATSSSSTPLMSASIHGKTGCAALLATCTPGTVSSGFQGCHSKPVKGPLLQKLSVCNYAICGWTLHSAMRLISFHSLSTNADLAITSS